MFEDQDRVRQIEVIYCSPPGQERAERSKLELACRIIGAQRSNPESVALSVFQETSLRKNVLHFADPDFHFRESRGTLEKYYEPAKPSETVLLWEDGEEEEARSLRGDGFVPWTDGEPGHLRPPVPSPPSPPPPQVIGIISLVPNGIQGTGNAGNSAGVGVRPFLAPRPDVSAKPSVSTTPKSTPSPVNSVPEDAVPRDSVPTVPTDPRDSPSNVRRPKHKPRIPIEEDPKTKNNHDHEGWLRRYHNHILVVLAFGGLCCLYVIWHFGSGIYYERQQRALRIPSAERTGASNV